MDSQDQHSLEVLLESPVGMRCDKSMMPACLESIKFHFYYLTDLYAKVGYTYKCSNGRFYYLECYESLADKRRILVKFYEVEHKMKIVDYFVPKQEERL